MSAMYSVWDILEVRLPGVHPPRHGHPPDLPMLTKGRNPMPSWNIHMQDLVFRKVNESDASKFAKKTKCCPAQFFGILWFLIALAFMVGAILAGIVVF